MQKFISSAACAVLAAGLVFDFTGCATTATTTSGTATTGSTSTASAAIEAALPVIRVGAAVATGAVLDFSVKQASTRTRLANEMYAAASAVYSLSGGSFPSPAQLESTITTFGGSQTDASYAQFSAAIAGLYAAWYPKLATGDAKTASDLLNAVAGGIEDATQSYLTTPATTTAAASSSSPSSSGRAGDTAEGIADSAASRLRHRADGGYLALRATEKGEATW